MTYLLNYTQKQENRTGCGAFLPTQMDEAELTLWRIERLLSAIARLEEGNKTAFARRFGYADGAFIRQMVKGKRPIGEKLIRRIEAEPGMAAWFSDTAMRDLAPLASQVRTEVANREVPEHVLRSVLELLRGFPEKVQKVA